MEVEAAPQVVEWAVASAPLPGEEVCGDLHLVLPLGGGVLLGAVDGLGHGQGAAEAAQSAVAALTRYAGRPVAAVLQLCHQALRGTRGVALSLGAIGGSELTWAGVGDVEAVLVRQPVGRPLARSWLVRRGGVLGFQLPPITPGVLPVARGDLIRFATDGIREGFADELDLTAPAAIVAERIPADFRKRTDDALVLVARYLGP
jgi:phosphoserine phosphatase RsbX